jgi:hypothetical protein
VDVVEFLDLPPKLVRQAAFHYFFLVRKVFQLNSVFRVSQNLALTPGLQKYRFQTIDPAASGFIDAHQLCER